MFTVCRFDKVNPRSHHGDAWPSSCNPQPSPWHSVMVLPGVPYPPPPNKPAPASARGSCLSLSMLVVGRLGDRSPPSASCTTK